MVILTKSIGTNGRWPLRKFVTLLGWVMLFFVLVASGHGCGSGTSGGGGGGSSPSGGTTVATIALSPPSPSIQVGQTQQFVATAMDANGYPIPGVSFTWTSSNPTVASIDATGLATGLSVGTATITASAGGVTSNGDQLVTSGGTTYTTDFPLTENPISEGGNWINGKVVGLDWSDVQTSGGEAYGTQPNHTTPPPYNDSIAILTGNWPADQKVQATVKIAQSNPAAFQEVEFWLRFTLTANSALGYGIAFRTTNDGSQYLDIGPMLGPINAFGGGVHLTAADGYAGIKDGDILAAQIVANVITVFVNGVLVAQWTDSQFATGNPGIGFWLRGDYVNGPSDYGFSNFTASGVSGT